MPNTQTQKTCTWKSLKYMHHVKKETKTTQTGSIYEKQLYQIMFSFTLGLIMKLGGFSLIYMWLLLKPKLPPLSASQNITKVPGYPS